MVEEFHCQDVAGFLEPHKEDVEGLGVGRVRGVELGEDGLRLLHGAVGGEGPEQGVEVIGAEVDVGGEEPLHLVEGGKGFVEGAGSG